MPDLPTFEELYEAAKAEAQSRRPSYTDWNDGSGLDSLTGMGSVLADEVVRQGVELFAAHFIDTAEGDQLDTLASDRFGLTRLAENASVGTLTFTRGGSSGVLPIPAGTTVEALVNGVRVQVTTDALATMGSGDSTVDVVATCTETGTTGNLAAGVLDDIIDTIPGDATATVTNADRFVGGRAEETDEEFRARIRRHFQTLRKATVSALEYGALQVGGVEFATVDESNIDPDDGGYVAVIIGDPDGQANDALNALVAAELEDWRAAGVEVRVESAVRETFTVSLNFKVRNGTDTAEINEAVRAAVLSYSDNLNPGKTWYVSKAICAGIDVAPDDILDGTCSTPSGDQTPTETYNALRVNTEDLTITFTEV